VETEEPTTPQGPSSTLWLRSDLTYTLLALALFTASCTMIADFTHRMIAADPDSVGILSIALQIAAAIAASSTFSKSGWALVEGSLSHADTKHGKTLFRLRLATIFCLLVTILWLFLPSLLARYYFTLGYNSEKKGDFAEATHNYQRAISLDPAPQYFYVNSGVVLERFYRYDDAAEQYRKAIVANLGDPVPYSDLARVLLLDNKPATALRIARDGLALPSHIPVATAALLKNKAWAEWLLGFAQAAIEDAKQSQEQQKQAANPNAAAATCLLGKIYTKLGRNDEAQQEWMSFRIQAAGPKTGQPDIEPDCQLFAEEANAQK
jgi:tetratricopeptide (TPR) repeat protein